MYAALQQAANSAGSLANYPGATVSGVMGSWVSQAGHPVVVVSVDSDTGNITLRQVIMTCPVLNAISKLKNKIIFVIQVGILYWSVKYCFFLSSNIFLL